VEEHVERKEKAERERTQREVYPKGKKGKKWGRPLNKKELFVIYLEGSREERGQNCDKGGKVRRSVKGRRATLRRKNWMTWGASNKRKEDGKNDVPEYRGKGTGGLLHSVVPKDWESEREELGLTKGSRFTRDLDENGTRNG